MSTLIESSARAAVQPSAHHLARLATLIAFCAAEGILHECDARTTYWHRLGYA